MSHQKKSLMKLFSDEGKAVMRTVRLLAAAGIILISVMLLISCGAEDTAQDIDNTGEKQQQGQAPDDQKENESEEDIEPEGDADKEETTEMNTDNIKINTQSSIKIEGSKTIYIDPYKRAKAMHDADIIFITHAHYDHYDEPSLRNVAKEDSVIVCPESMLADVTAMNVRVLNGDMDEGIISMNAGDTAEAAPGITVEAVPAYNINKNFHPKANGWLGYIITMDGVRYYAAGDTDALPELEDVECDIAFVPVGGTYTATAAESARLVNKIRPQIAIPIHYGTIVGRAAEADTFGAALDDGIRMVKKVEDAR